MEGKKRGPRGPILSKDFYGHSLRKGDIVNYAIPNNWKGAGKMALGQVTQKRHCYLEIICLHDKHYEDLHCKRGTEVIKVPPNIQEQIEPYF